MTSPPAQTTPAEGQRESRGRRRKARVGLSPTARAPSGQVPAPMRQCASCRARRAQDALVQLHGEVAPEVALEGKARAIKVRRYVCAHAGCITQLAKAMGRQHGEDFTQNLAALAQVRFVGMLGLARRQGDVVVGAGRIADPKTDPEGLRIFVASDMAERTRRQLVAGGEVQACMLTAAQMGRSVGGNNVAALGLKPGRLGLRAAYWLRVWYEAMRASTARGTQQMDPATPATLVNTTDEIEVAR